MTYPGPPSSDWLLGDPKAYVRIDRLFNKPQTELTEFERSIKWRFYATRFQRFIEYALAMTVVGFLVRPLTKKWLFLSPPPPPVIEVPGNRPTVKLWWLHDKRTRFQQNIQFQAAPKRPWTWADVFRVGKFGAVVWKQRWLVIPPWFISPFPAAYFTLRDLNSWLRDYEEANKAYYDALLERRFGISEDSNAR